MVRRLSQFSSPSRARRRGTRRRGGFTLVEMLVATTVTLLLILAIAQAFAVVSDTVILNRATLEMAGQMRGVAIRLQKDLAGLTVPVRPVIQSAMGQGYFELYDGSACDLDADADGLADSADMSPVAANTSFGDIDDIWMGTVRNDSEPFAGLVLLLNGDVQVDKSDPNTTLTAIHSPLAEVVWWTVLGDTNQDGIADPGETYNIHRRALLIRPDLNGTGGTIPGTVTGYVTRFPPVGGGNPASYDVGNAADRLLMSRHLRSFYNHNDLSVHFVRVETGTNVVLYAIANTLSDLTIRQNRFCHDPILYGDDITDPTKTTTYYLAAAADHFPHPLNVYWTVRRDAAGAATLGYYSDLTPPRLIRSADRMGEDVMLSNALAFDIQVFDPHTLLGAHPGLDYAWGVRGVNDDGLGSADDVLEAGWSGSDDEVLTPEDPGYGFGAAGAVEISKNPPMPVLKEILPVGTGAFVDLSYFAKAMIQGYPSTYDTPHFSGTCSGKSRLFGLSNTTKQNLLNPAAAMFDTGTYDTWPFDYENDGVDQDGDGVADEGTNGIDDDGANGVDDPAERETAPPYGYPLRGMRVRIRMIDPDTRQVRQVPVVSTFLRD